VNRRSRGFTLIELVVTLALVGLVAMIALPLAEVTSTRSKEAELRVALRSIRTALDAYKAAADAGKIAREAGASGYPPSLEKLVEGADVVQAPAGAASAAGPRRLVFLRKLPRDPFFEDAAVPDAQTWALRSYDSPADDPQPGVDVFDVRSSSTRKAMDGSSYASW